MKMEITDKVKQWRENQGDIRKRWIEAPLGEIPRFVAGADCAFVGKETIFAAAVVYDRVEKQIVETKVIHQAVAEPYIPGYLSFREGEAVLKAIRSLEHRFEAVMFDGQGYAHPRRCGIALHLGVLLDMPSVGVGKSRLIGEFDEPGEKRGEYSKLMDGKETLGAVLRTKDGVKPVFVSVGHRMDLKSAIELTLACDNGYRIPEPTRMADIHVEKGKFGNMKK